MYPYENERVMKKKSGPEQQQNDVVTGHEPLDRTPPEHFTLDQKLVWKEVIGLVDDSVVNKDRILLHDLCVAIELAQQMERDIRRHGIMILGQKDNWVKNPLLAPLNAQQQLIFRIANVLGMSPRSRATMKLQEPAVDVDDQLEPAKEDTSEKQPWDE